MATRNQYIGEQDHLVHSPQNCKDKHADSRHCDIYPFNCTELCKSSRIVTPSLICILTSLALETSATASFICFLQVHDLDHTHLLVSI